MDFGGPWNGSGGHFGKNVTLAHPIFAARKNWPIQIFDPEQKFFGCSGTYFWDLSVPGTLDPKSDAGFGLFGQFCILNMCHNPIVHLELADPEKPVFLPDRFHFPGSGIEIQKTKL